MNHNPLSKILRTLGTALCSVFGQVNWNSPPWFSAARNKAKESPKTFWGLTVLLIGLLIASAYGLQWYNNRPKPINVVARITQPAITPNEETLVPQNLTVDFGLNNSEFTTRSVAPLNHVGKPVADGIDITPKIKGEWIWNSDSQLVFIPSEEWAADQKYNVHFAPDFFSANVIMGGYDYSFNTKPFTAKISEFKLYQDPVHADVRNAVASIHFNYGVTPASLEQNTSLAFQEIKTATRHVKNQAIKFSYTYDENKRIAYLRSESIQINDVPRFVDLTLTKNIQSASGATLSDVQKDILYIPDSSNFLKVTSAAASIVRNEKNRPEQVLTVETTLGINETEFNKSIHIYLLPKDYPKTSTHSAESNFNWSEPGQVNEFILSKATLLTKEAIPAEQNYSSLHSFKFNAPQGRFIYVKLDKGMKSFGGFSLANNYAAVIEVPQFPQEISFLHQGSLLALTGEKKLSVLLRGVPAARFDFARVLPDNINQLVTQTAGDFNNPYFLNPSLNEQNISEMFSETQYFSSDPAKQEYAVLDLKKYLTAKTYTLGPQGLFLLKARGWDPQTQSNLDVSASRLILITDLAMIVKDNNDKTHDVFVSSITEGVPVSGVRVTVLAKNGLPILSATTDEQGRVNIPSLTDFVDDKEPIAYLANLNNDVSFIPYNNYQRQLNFSKFDIDGIYTYNHSDHNVSAFLFSDRGIYRPGDTAHIGVIVKQAYAQHQSAGIPLQLTIQDARGTTIKDEKLSLNKSGFMDVEFTTNANSPTGEYSVNLFLVRDGRAQNLLGSTQIRVAEFQPDRMRISSRFEPKPIDGWSSPADLKAKVDLWNLYGAPATDRRISARILLTPQDIRFSDYPDYHFADPLLDPKKPAKVFTEALADSKTDDNGHTEFNLPLERFEQATYQLTFFAEGFEAEGGKSVTTQTKVLVSPRPYFVGFKADGDLSFIKQNNLRTINYLAVNPQLTNEEVNELTVQLISLHPVTTLVKKADGTYQYQSITQSTVVNSQPFTIEKQGTDYKVPTATIGDYALNVLDKQGIVLSQLKFSVVGSSQQPLAKNAELSIKLDKEEYQAGEDIELQITAPYTGSGLITIERDNVYATQWFKTDSTSSVQSIRIPKDFEGNGYINVAFIRDWESPELFISPLSYSVAPFKVDNKAHEIQIELNTVSVAKPGEPFAINYRSDKPGKIIVFAVDEGILQVANYHTPNPLAFFFQKHALQVLTQQTVDQILPKFIQDREFSAAGGDDGDENLASRLNPFKRKTDLPIAYWSGIVDTDNRERQLTYEVPDYFNGTLRIMAVAVSTDSVGSTDTSAQIRGDFIINPNVPTFVAPGDEFDISATVANNVKDSGDHANITVTIITSPEIELVGAAQQAVEIKEGREQTVRFKLKAKSLLGAAKVTLSASDGSHQSNMSATLSVRPATPLMTHISSGQTKEKQKNVSVIQNFYSAHRAVNATLSQNPLIFIFGLQRYLDNYPFGCTEQLTSKALPLLAMNKQSWFDKNQQQINEKIASTIEMLAQRQMSHGGFSYWPGSGDYSGNQFASIYAMHFLTESRAQGFNVPSDLFYNGLSYLKDFASQTTNDKDKARLQAYAIYILTRNELVTTNYLTNLQLFLEHDSSHAWKKEITGAYIAASYEMLQSHAEANKLIEQYQIQNEQAYDNNFYDSSSSDAQYLYIVAKHFPNLLERVSNQLLMTLVAAINNNEINTILSGYTSMALSAYKDNMPEDKASQISLGQLLDNNQQSTIPLGQDGYLNHVIGEEVKQLIFNNPEHTRYFYQVVQSGFDKTLAKNPVKNGMEIFREYRDSTGQAVNSTTLGSELEVHVQIRSLNNSYLTHVAIEDLLPGGFDVVRDSVTSQFMDFADAREDRVNFFGTVSSTARELVYKIKATNVGVYTIPPAYAQSMYNPDTQARGVAGVITITARP